MNEANDMHPSGSKSKGSIGVNAFNTKNSESEDEVYPLKASEMKDDLRRPAKPFFRSETDLDATLVRTRIQMRRIIVAMFPRKIILQNPIWPEKNLKGSQQISTFLQIYIVSH